MSERRLDMRRVEICTGCRRPVRVPLLFGADGAWACMTCRGYEPREGRALLNKNCQRWIRIHPYREVP